MRCIQRRNPDDFTTLTDISEVRGDKMFYAFSDESYPHQYFMLFDVSNPIAPVLLDTTSIIHPIHEILMTDSQIFMSFLYNTKGVASVPYYADSFNTRK